MKARFTNAGVTVATADDLSEAFIHAAGVQRIGTDHDGFYTLAGVEDDGTRRYEWRAASINEWLGLPGTSWP